MSTTSLMFHAFGVSGFQLKNTEYSNGEITFNLIQDKHNLRCPVCHSSKVKRQGKRYRKLRSVPIGNKRTFIAFDHQRVECEECNSIRYVNVNFVEKEKQHTRGFKNYALALLRFSTVKHVADHLGAGWDLIKSIDKTDLKRFEKIVFKDIKQIAVDEIYLGKKGKYITIVLNIETGAIVYVGEGKGADSLDEFWPKIKRSKATIEAVASDMSPAYAKAIRDHIPNAVHVTDHFHVIKLFNEKLTKLRRDLYNEVETIAKKKALKGSRWILLKNPENLTDKNNEIERLNDALKLNEPLAKAYYLKDELRQFWSYKSKTEAESNIMSWIVKAEASGVKMLIRFAKTIRKQFKQILAYYDSPISTGILEGTNNKIKTLTKQAYGFRDNDYFKLKLLGLHRSNYQLTG